MEIDQRRFRPIHPDLFNPADDDPVIAAVMDGVGAAGQRRGNAVQERRTGRPGRMAIAMHIKGLRPGEGVGNLPLIVGQQIDGEAAIGLGETGDATGPVVEADQDQRRVERHRAKGADGDTHGAAVVAGRCHHGDAGREAAESVSEFDWINHDGRPDHPPKDVEKYMRTTPSIRRAGKPRQAFTLCQYLFVFTGDWPVELFHLA